MRVVVVLPVYVMILPCIHTAPLVASVVVLDTVRVVAQTVAVAERVVGCLELKKLVLSRNGSTVFEVDCPVAIFVTVPEHISSCALLMNISSNE